MRAAGPQLWLEFRAPEMVNSSRLNHETATAGTDFSALQTLQGFSSGCQPQRGPTVAVTIIPPARNAAISVLPRRLLPGCRLWLDFRAPERANSSRYNHTPST